MVGNPYSSSLTLRTGADGDLPPLLLGLLQAPRHCIERMSKALDFLWSFGRHSLCQITASQTSRSRAQSLYGSEETLGYQTDQQNAQSRRGQARPQEIPLDGRCQSRRRWLLDESWPGSRVYHEGANLPFVGNDRQKSSS